MNPGSVDESAHLTGLRPTDPSSRRWISIALWRVPQLLVIVGLFWPEGIGSLWSLGFAWIGGSCTGKRPEVWEGPLLDHGPAPDRGAGAVCALAGAAAAEGVGRQQRKTSARVAETASGGSAVVRPAARRSLVVLLLAGAVASCDGGPEGRPADMRGMMDMEGMMQMMRNMPEGIPASELPQPASRPARLVAEYCSQCHGIPTPRRLSAEEWPLTLRRMTARMERMQRMPMRSLRAPSPEEVRIMLDYLEDNALRTTPADSLPTNPAAHLFARTCSRCHALPDPAQHAAGEWPGVVERMRENMRRMEVDGITDEQAGRIVEFLQRHARDGGPTGSN